MLLLFYFVSHPELDEGCVKMDFNFTTKEHEVPIAIGIHKGSQRVKYMELKVLKS